MDEDDRWMRMIGGCCRVGGYPILAFPPIILPGPRGLFHLSLGSAEGKVQLSFELVS